MRPRPLEERPFLSRQRSNSVPTLGLVNVSEEEAGMLFSAAERATARRKRPVSVDSPGPVVVERRQVDQPLPERTFNFSTPSRHGFGISPLRHVQRSASVETIQPETTTATSSPDSDPEDVEPTPLASSFPSSAQLPQSLVTPISPTSPRRILHNPVLKAYADGMVSFTQTRLNSAAPETLRTLGLRRDPSLPATPELDINELPLPPPPRPVFRSQFSDWSSTRASSVFEPSSPPSPNEPQTPDEQTGFITPDSFFTEITPRVAQTAQWAASLSSARTSTNVAEDTFFVDSPTMGTLYRSRTDSVTSSEAFSYFSGFDGTTEAAGTRLSNDLSPITRQFRLQASARSTPGSSPSNHPPFAIQQQAHSPFADMPNLSRTSSWQVPAMG